MGARHLLQSFHAWRAAGEPLVLATVYETAGSTYSKAGHRILLAANGDYRGLVSGGCLEGDLAERARGVVQSGQAAAVTYDLRDSADELWGLGVGCNGLLRVFLQPLLADQRLSTVRRDRGAARGHARCRRGDGHRERQARTSPSALRPSPTLPASACSERATRARRCCVPASRAAMQSPAAHLDGRAGLPRSLCAAAADPEAARARRRPRRDTARRHGGGARLVRDGRRSSARLSRARRLRARRARGARRAARGSRPRCRSATSTRSSS